MEINERDEMLKKKYPELFQLAKNFWALYHKEILANPRNYKVRMHGPSSSRRIATG